MHRLSDIAVVAIFVGLTLGCASSPASRFYTLSAQTAPAATPSNFSIAVGPVSVPAVVDRPQIVVNVGPHQVRLEEFHRWAAPLQDNIARVIADNLVVLLGTPRVTLSARTVNADVDYRAFVDVQSFQSMPGEAVMLDAVWTVRRTKDGKSESGRSTVRETVKNPTFDALAAAHSRALARLSQDIAGAVAAMARSGP